MKRRSLSFEIRLSLLYIAIGAGWILFSDQLVALLPENFPGVNVLQTYKGWGYVLITGLLLYALLRYHARKQASVLEKLQASEQQFRYLFACNPLPMWIYDLETRRLLDVNVRMLEQYGYTRDEFLAMPLANIHPQEAVDAVQAHAAAPRPALQHSGEWQQRRKDGSVFTVEIISHILELAGQQAVLVVAQDITDRKRLEQERTEGERLRLALHKEMELRELKNRFMSMLAHEFRNPLTTIGLSAELLATKRAKMTEDMQTRHLDRIQEQVRNLTDLMEDILQLTRAEVLTPGFKPLPHDIEQLCASVVEEMRLKTKPQQTIVYTSECTQKVLAIDEKQIRQAVGNLLSNAVKYSDEGSTIHVESFCQSGQFRLRVRDQGVGIPSKDLKKLFEPFQRAENVRGIPGTGLGLAITRQAVRMHGGEVEVESTEGRGTTFTLYLPLNDFASA